jgi:uncharacterized protein involved in response to NO
MIPWLWYVWAAVAFAVTGGFGFGAAAFLWPPEGACWIALVEAHGHIQLFGWAGLMVLGVGLFFLPRLRGAPLAAPGLALPALLLLSLGLLLQLATPVACVLGSPAGQATHLLGGSLELAGAGLVVAALARTARRGPPLRTRAGLRQVLPYLVLAFASLLLALSAGIAASAAGPLGASPDTAQALRDAAVHLGIVGFLVPVSIGVSARSFPLFLWTPPPSARGLRLAFWALLSGLALSVAGILAGSPALAVAGTALEGASLLVFAAALRVLPLRRRDAGFPAGDPHYVKPVERLLVSSYHWLTLAGLAKLLRAGGSLGIGPSIPADVELHALGSGFVTLLIFGMGVRMLPGFAGRTIASVGLVSATLWLGNLSAALRVAPPLWSAMTGGVPWPLVPAATAMGVAGLLGIAAVACFGLNLWLTLVRPGASPGARSPGAAPR